MGPVQVLEQGVLVVQPGSSLHFPAADHLQDIIRDRALAGMVLLSHQMEMGTPSASQITSGGAERYSYDQTQLWAA